MNTNKFLFAAIAILAILQVITFISVTGKKATLGSATHFSGPIDSEEGFTVDDTTRIDGSGAGTFTTTTINSLFVDGTVWSTTTGVAGTSTASVVCGGNTLWYVTPLVEASTLRFPSTTTLFADCLTSDGAYVDFSIYNATTSGTSSDIRSVLTLTEGWELGTSLHATSADPAGLYEKDFANVRVQRVSVTTSTVSVDIHRNR